MHSRRRQANGKYQINGKTYDLLEGSRAQVWHETALETSGGLKKGQLIQNKCGRIVSRKKHASAKKEKRLEKAGYFTKKGTFGSVHKDKGSKKRRSKKRRGGSALTPSSYSSSSA
jgi:hypothetical protein